MNYNKAGLLILLSSVFFSFAYFAGLILFSPPMEIAEFDETSSADRVDLSELKKPWLGGPEMLLHGSKVYQTYCASCHGASGAGDGPAGGGLDPPPRSLIKGGWKNGGSSIALYQTLLNGIEGGSMVSFSYLSKTDRWALVHYVRSITKDKPEDDVKKLEEFAKTAK